MSRYWILGFYLFRYHQRKTIMCRHVAKGPCPVSDSVAVEPSPPTGDGLEDNLQPRLSSDPSPVGGDGSTATESDTGLFT